MRDCTHVILVAEDDPDDQELIAIAFSKADPSIKLCIVNNGRAVLDYLQNATDTNLPCVILLDYNMPELNGAQVIQSISPDKRFAVIPKIILSTSDNPQYIEDALQKGANAYKIKPDNFQQLVSIAEEMAALCKQAA